MAERKNAKFTNLRTYGAFLVSSSCKDGEIEYVTIVSEKGRTCKIENPWGNTTCKVIYVNGEETVYKSQQFEIKTSPGQIIKLVRLN